MGCRVGHQSQMQINRETATVLRQTVTLDGASVTLSGEGSIEIDCESDEEKMICKGTATIVASNGIA